MKKSINLPSFWFRPGRHMPTPAQKIYTRDTVELKKGIYEVLVTASGAGKAWYILPGYPAKICTWFPLLVSLVQLK